MCVNGIWAKRGMKSVFVTVEGVGPRMGMQGVQCNKLGSFCHIHDRCCLQCGD